MFPAQGKQPWHQNLPVQHIPSNVMANISSTRQRVTDSITGTTGHQLRQNIADLKTEISNMEADFQERTNEATEAGKELEQNVAKKTAETAKIQASLDLCVKQRENFRKKTVNALKTDTELEAKKKLIEEKEEEIERLNQALQEKETRFVS